MQTDTYLICHAVLSRATNSQKYSGKIGYVLFTLTEFCFNRHI